MNDLLHILQLVWLIYLAKVRGLVFAVWEEVNSLSNEMLKLQQMLLPCLSHKKWWDTVTTLVIAIWEAMIIYNSDCYEPIKHGESGAWNAA